MTKSAWQKYKEKNGITPLDALNPYSKKVEEDLAEHRMSICRACPEFFKASGQCKKCGCFMTAKTKFEAAKCPLGKW